MSPPSPMADARSNGGRQPMDLDSDLDLEFWPFDPNALFASASPSNNPPSPPWLFEDNATASGIWNSFVGDFTRVPNCNSDTTSGNINQDDGKTRKSQSSTTVEYSNDYCRIRERMTLALRYFKESTDQHVLVQVWAPVKNGNRYVLTTSGQPFVLHPQSLGLLQYRTVSMMYMFSVDGDNEGDLGLPGRVFRQKMPEWTPDVQFYSSKEYPRLYHAQHYDVRGTLALPVFEPSRQSCVGVVELIMTSQKMNYAAEVDKVCKALEAVNLRSYETLDSPSVQICNEGRQTVLAEILEILTTVCEEYKLPLAQTWIPCRHRSVLAQGGGPQKSCSSFDGSCMGQVCMSTSDVAFYVIDAQMWRFRDACIEHHLQKGQGVAGQAFESRHTCFSSDITHFGKTEYPLVHYARLFGLYGCLAICLQSVHTGTDDYVIEFFLPPDCKIPHDQQILLDSMSASIKKCFRSLKMTNEDLQGKSPGFIDLRSSNNLYKEPTNSPENNTNHEEPIVPGSGNDANIEKNAIGTTAPSINPSEKKLERKRGKAEKSISLEVLRQYFSGSLKDAAKAHGVCPTTMKRICRQHGISRWPSRKINKVSHSLSKLKRVIESVQGAEGAFNLPSLACRLPLAAVSLNECKHDEGPKLLISQYNELDKDSLLHKSPYNSDDGCNNIGDQPETTQARAISPLELDNSKTSSSSGEESTDAPTSQESCEVNRRVSPDLRKDFDVSNSMAFINSITNADIEEPQTMLGNILIEDCGSSKDLKNLFSCVVEGCDQPNSARMHELRTITIKATYKEDIIRFRLPVDAGMVELNDEVAKRLKLEVGSFDIRYLDDDQEWVMLSCDADLKECIEIASLSGIHIIRLSVLDVLFFLGSSGGSSD